MPQQNRSWTTINNRHQGSVLSPIMFSSFINKLQMEIGRHNRSLKKRAELSQCVEDSVTCVSAVKRAQNSQYNRRMEQTKYCFIINSSKNTRVWVRFYQTLTTKQ